MVEISGRYDGELSCVAMHGPSGAEMTTDAPVDNQGRGRTFSPTDLVATALGTCVMTIIGIFAARKGLDITGATFRVTKEMAADPHRRIARLPLTVVLAASVPAELRPMLERAAHGCPVHRSLDARVEAPITFEYV